MRFLEKLVGILFCGIFPPKVQKVLSTRFERTKKVMTGNQELRFFWRVLFFPIVLPISLLIAVIKVLLIWTVPERILDDWAYLFNQFYTDIAVERTGVKLAWKRVCLCNRLLVKGAEKRISCGDKNPDKTFYVLRPYYYMKENELVTNISNLLFHYYRNLQHLAYAIEHDWIPVVDWENYGPFPHEESYPILGTVNCWEYYWNQPSQYTLEEVYQSKNVILSIQNTRDNQFVPSAFYIEPLQRQAEDYAARCPKYDEYITFNDFTSKYVKEKQDKLFPPNARILGVAVRGTSYGSENTSGHPVQPELKKLIRKIKRIMNEWEMEYLYFTCELQGTIDEIRAAFGDQVLIFPRLRYTTQPKHGDVEKGLDPLYVPGQKYQTNLDYLAETVLLSRCTSLYAAMSSSVRAAIIWNKGHYEDMRIIENGLW